MPPRKRDIFARLIHGSERASASKGGPEGPYRVERVISSRQGELTEVVWKGNEGPYLRKVMPASLVSYEAWSRLARAKSPHLPTLVDLREASGDVVAVTSFVEGESLEDLVNREGALTFEHAARVCGEVAEAAQALHEVGVVHRDITPGNVMLSPDGAVLVKLGIARITGDTSASKEQKRHDTHVLGTWGFAAPEQFGFAATDRRSDIYALGKLLGFMLTGAYPDDARYDELLDDSNVVPPPFAEVIHHATAFEPSKRQRTASEFADDVRNALEQSTPEHARRVKRTLVGAAICLAAVIACLAIFVWIPGAMSAQQSESSILDDIDFDYAESVEGGDGAYGAFYELGASLGDQILEGLKDSGEAGIEKINEQGGDSTTDDGSATVAPSEGTEASLPKPTASFASFEVVKDYQDEPALLVTLEYTNKTSETTSFSGQYWVRAFQDGVELKPTGSPDYDLGSSSTYLRPNAHTTVYELIRLDNVTSPVEVELLAWEYYGDGPLLSETVEL